MSNGDVRVFGLTPGTHVLTDLGMDVPQGVTVVIPGAKAYASKDLWRAISQKCVFHLNSGPPGVQVKSNSELDTLRWQVQALTDENTRLREALVAKAQEPQPTPQPSTPPVDLQAQTKLDDILALLRAGVMPGAGASSQRSSEPPSGVVSGEVPTYIPSQIKPEGVDVQISTTPEESKGAGIGDAASALRNLRKGRG